MVFIMIYDIRKICQNMPTDSQQLQLTSRHVAIFYIKEYFKRERANCQKDTRKSTLTDTQKSLAERNKTPLTLPIKQLIT